MLLYAYSHVLLTNKTAMPDTPHSFSLALHQCSQIFPASNSYNSPLSKHSRPGQSYRRNYGLGDIHLALPLAKQTKKTKLLLSHLQGDVARLPDRCVKALQAIGKGLPHANSFASGVDGIKYIGLEGPDLITGLTMTATKSIKSLLKSESQVLKQCSDDVNMCFLSSINRSRDAAGLSKLQKNPPMKPAIIITSKESQCQIPHMDVKETELRQASFVGFIPLTTNGMYLEVWPLNDLHAGMKQIRGQLIFIPLGVLLLLPATTLHAGGMKAPLPPMTTDECRVHSHDIASQHPRLHFYIFPTRDDAYYKTCNLFVMPPELQLQLDTDSTHFSELFVHSSQLQYTATNPGQLAIGLLNDVSPIWAMRTNASY